MIPSTDLPARSVVPHALVALVVPDRGMPQVARSGSVRGPLAVAILCALLAGAAGAVRVDGRDATLAKLEAAGELKNASDRQIEEATTSAERAYVVKRVGAAAASAPFELLLGTGGLLVLSWFLRGHRRSGSLLPVAAAALLPGALADLLETISVLRRTAIAPGDSGFIPRSVASLCTTFGFHPAAPFDRLLGAFDLFSLWSALMLGFGLAAAAKLPRTRALVATLTGWIAWRLFTHVVLGGGA